MQYRVASCSAIFTMMLAGLSGSAGAESYYDVSWVQANGKGCYVVCRDNGGRLPVDHTGTNGTTIHACRAPHGGWPGIGYQQTDACVILKGDRKTPGVVATNYECLCGRRQ